VQVLAGDGEGLCGASGDAIDRACADARAEELFGELGRVAAGDAVADRQRRHRRLQPGAEGAPCHLGAQPGACLAPTRRAAQPLGAVLGHRG